MESKSVHPLATSLSRCAVLAPSYPSAHPPSRHPWRGRKLCRWRRKPLINTTVSDRYADPRHCKMAAISPSHSSGRQPSLAFSHPSSFRPPLSLSLAVHWTPEGVSVSHSPLALPATRSSRSSAARAPDFHTPAAAATATAPPHQVERVEARTLPLGSACLTRLRRVVPPDIYMRCDFIGRSWCRSKSHMYTRPPTHPSPVVVVIDAWGYFGTPGSH